MLRAPLRSVVLVLLLTVAPATLGPVRAQGAWEVVLTDVTREFEYRSRFGAILLAAEEIDFVTISKQDTQAGIDLAFQVVRLHETPRFPDQLLAYSMTFQDAAGAYWYYTAYQDAGGQWDFVSDHPASGHYQSLEGDVDMASSTIVLHVPDAVFPAGLQPYGASSYIGNTPQTVLDWGVWYRDLILPGGARLDTQAEPADAVFDVLYRHPATLTN